MSQKKIRIGEHIITLPPMPTNRNEILFINEKKENAYWRRIPCPAYFEEINEDTKFYQKLTLHDQDGRLVSLGEEDSERVVRFLEDDMRRRINGVWANINGQIVWIPGDYYFTLQWAQMKDLPTKYGNFRWPQNDLMILWWYAKTSPWIAGLVLAKAKKTGASQIIAGGAFVNEATGIVEGKEFGMVSKDFPHVRDVAMGYFFHAYDHLPYIMQPEWKGRNMHSIRFGKIPPRPGAKRKPTTGRVLNNNIVGYKTKTGAFDGPVMYQEFCDETPKMWESSKVNVDSFMKKTSESVKLQQKINGTAFFCSYMPEIDDMGSIHFRQWYKDSKLDTVNKNTGKTRSTFIAHLMSAVDSNEEAFDYYGRCDRKIAYSLVMDDRNQKRDLAGKMAHRRQYPINENDAFDPGGAGTVFDNLRLSEQYRHTDEAIAARTEANKPFSYTRLEWAYDKEKDSFDWNQMRGLRPEGNFRRVVRRDCTLEEFASGEFATYPLIVHHDLPELMLNQVLMRNIRDEEDGCLRPLDDTKSTPMVMSWDPTDWVKASEVLDGSMNAGIGGFIHNPAMDLIFGKPITNTILFEYFFRNEDPDEDYEHLVKLIIYYGCRVLVEGNKPWVVKKLVEDGLQHFLLLKQKDGTIRPYTMAEENKGVYASKDMINAYVNALKRWMVKPGPEGGGVDYVKTIQSLTGLTQLMGFTPADTKRWDWAVAAGWWRIAIESYCAFMIWYKTNNSRYSKEGLEAALNALLYG